MITEFFNNLTSAILLFKVVFTCLCKKAVAPLAGAWIETYKKPQLERLKLTSRLSQARGLKQWGYNYISKLRCVAPLAGAWIETMSVCPPATRNEVAPLAGAWIETGGTPSQSPEQMSRLSQARGLKRGLGSRL